MPFVEQRQNMANVGVNLNPRASLASTFDP